MSVLVSLIVLALVVSRLQNMLSQSLIADSHGRIHVFVHLPLLRIHKQVALRLIQQYAPFEHLRRTELLPQ